MKSPVHVAAMIYLVLLAAAVPHAENLSFDEVSPGLHASVNSQGFVVTSYPAFFVSSDQPTFCSPECAFNGSPSLLSQNGINPIILSRADSSPFHLLAFDYAEQTVGSPVSASSLQVTGVLASGGSVVASFLLDGINDGSGPLDDFQLAVLAGSFRNLDSVSFVGIGGPTSDRYSLDNIVVVAIPEPSTGFLAAEGLLGLALFRRRLSSRYRGPPLEFHPRRPPAGI
jgi:hypothetical protein